MRSFLILAIVIALFFVFSTGVNTTRTGTTSSTFDKIIVVNTTEPSGRDRVAESFLGIEADAVCQKEFSVLFVDTGSQAVLLLYATPEPIVKVAYSGLTQPEVDTNTDALYNRAESLCDAGLLDAFEQEVNARIDA